MRRLTVRLITALLAFIVGICACALWVKRQAILDACAEWLRNYQD